MPANGLLFDRLFPEPNDVSGDELENRIRFENGGFDFAELCCYSSDELDAMERKLVAHSLKDVDFQATPHSDSNRD